MSRIHKVRATKVRQQGVAARQTKPGVPYKGANLVAQREASAKKTARKSSSTRRSA